MPMYPLSCTKITSLKCTYSLHQTVLNLAVEWMTPLLVFWKYRVHILAKRLAALTGYSRFPQCLQFNAGKLPKIRPWLNPSRSYHSKPYNPRYSQHH
jgi:hypothetical protein